MVVASKNFQDFEYGVPKKIFEEAGYEVVTVSSKKEVTSKLGEDMTVDLLLDEVKEEDYQAVVFVGGGGCKEYFDNKVAHNLANAFEAKKKIVAAICLAPVILGHAGVVKGRKVTCHEGGEEKLKKLGFESTREDVVVDGNLITGNGPDAAEKFGIAIVKALSE